MFEDIWFYLAIVLGVTTVALIVLFLIERERRLLILKGAGGSVEKAISPEEALLRRAGKSVSEEALREVRNKLRVLDVEREILSYAIRRLYEAHAEGKITSEERDSLAIKYREDLERIKQEMARGESIIALSDLEKMQEEFIKMFSEKLDALNRRIEELRAIAGLKPPEQVVSPKVEDKAEAAEQQAPPAQQEPAEQAEKQVSQRRRREAAKPRAAEQASEREADVDEKPGGAEESIERIMAEIEKVLSRLNQMEVEE